MSVTPVSSLYRETIGRSGPPMVFLHPMPHDLTAWAYQTAHFSTWCRTIAIDLPGHGRSPRALPGMTMADVAQACWDAVDEEAPAESIVLAGLSVGSHVAKYMVNAKPRRVDALVLTAGGFFPGPKGIAAQHVEPYREQGLAHKREHLAANFSAAFRDTEIARYFIDLAMERNVAGDVEGTVRLMLALDPPDPDWLHPGITVPTLIVTGGEDGSRPRTEEMHRRIAGSELQVIDGTGHCCNIERPAEYDRIVLDFLRRQRLL